MSLVFLPLIIALGICLLPIWLLPRRNFQRPRDYFIASQPTPPDVMRNSGVSYPMRIATLGPFFAWGANGDLWPAIIGAGTRLVDTYVGPYTAIGANCELRDAEIEHSVVLERSRIIGVHHIHDSLLGREVEVVRSGERPKATRLMLGDHSRADLE